MSTRAKILAGLLVLAMVLSLGLLGVLAAGVVAFMSVEQAARQQQNSCGVPTAQLVTDSGGPVQLPVVGSFAATSEFGMRMHPVLGRAKMHWGIDLAERPHGGPIVAVKDGVVEQVSSGGAAGNWVRLNHGGGLTTRYLHLQQATVTAGQQVKVGQQVGVEGATGRVSGPHLHFEVKQGNGSPQDPRAWLAAQGLKLPGPGQSADAATINAAANPAGAPTINAAAASPAPTAAGGTAPKKVAGWTDEQVANAAAIIKAGQALGADTHTVTLGVMTAIGESTLIVVDHGDAAGPDSRGLFQQRANGAWGSYADRMNPTISATNFFKALMAVPGYKELPPTIAAHKTQGNQDENHYAKFWPKAVALVSQITGDSSLMAAATTTDGSSVPCAAPGGDAAMNVGSMPGAPSQSCPATGNPAESGLQPPTLRLLRCSRVAFPRVTSFAGVGDRDGPSDHPAGYGLDLMINKHKTPAGRAYGWQVAEWTRAHAQELGVSYVIFDMKIWSVSQDSAGWRPYTRYGPNPSDRLGHRDHVHVSLKR